MTDTDTIEMVDNLLVRAGAIGDLEVVSAEWDTLVVPILVEDDDGPVRVLAVGWFAAGGFDPGRDPTDAWPYLVTVWSALSGSGLAIVDEEDPPQPEWLPAGGRWADRVVNPPFGSACKRAMEDAGMINPESAADG